MHAAPKETAMTSTLRCASSTSSVTMYPIVFPLASVCRSACASVAPATASPAPRQSARNPGDVVAADGGWNVHECAVLPAGGFRRKGMLPRSRVGRDQLRVRQSKTGTGAATVSP